MKFKDVTFEDLLGFFPPIELPITLTEDSSIEFSKQNKALPEMLIHQFLKSDNDDWDELTEVVPCFTIPSTDNFLALVYWKASLQNYEYILTTFDLGGNKIDAKVIAGVVFQDNMIIRTVSTIDEDWIIHTVVGEENTDKTAINKSSKAFTLELLATGEIIFALNENTL